MSLNELLNILACPGCKGPLTLENDGPGLACSQCRLRFPVRDGIPVMLVEEAEAIKGAEDSGQ